MRKSPASPPRNPNNFRLVAGIPCMAGRHTSSRRSRAMLPAFPFMGTARKRLERLKREARLNPIELPVSLEAAFLAIELPTLEHADTPEAHATAPRTTQERL